MIQQLHEVRARAKAQGWRSVLVLVAGALRTRVTNPWFRVYWIATNSVTVDPLPTNASFRVVSDPARDLNPAQLSALRHALGPRAVKQAEERLANGALLHVLFVEDRVAGTLYTVSGAARRFQHVILTDVDSMGLDARILPEFRGRGLFPVLLAQSVRALHACGQERYYADALETNTASLRTLDRVGFRFLTCYRVSWRRLYRFAEVAL